LEDSSKSTVTAVVPSQELFCFDISVQVIPHPDKVSSGGEDAYFIYERFGFGVADGVGGWSDGGVNPADYSRHIMRITAENLESDLDPKTALDLAHSKTRIPGSCTACLVKMDGVTGDLSVLNLGDSGMVILRENNVLARTTPQQHFFDCPRQLAAFPEHCESTDYPRDGEFLSLTLQEGDLIVMGTDGLWDNVFDAEMLNFTSNQYGRRKTVDELCEGLARLAQRNSLNEEISSPYSKAALAEGYDVSWFEKLIKAKIVDWRVQWGTLTGGKVDDITVIVAKVKKENFPISQ